MIVRYMTINGKTNEFKLIGGETIKIGRVKLLVKEIVTHEEENQTEYDSFDNETHIPHIENLQLGRDIMSPMNRNSTPMNRFAGFT